MFISIKHRLGKVFPMISISLLYSKKSYASNLKTARKERFFNGATSNWFLYDTMGIPENWAPETLVGPLWDPAKTKKKQNVGWEWTESACKT